MRVIGVDEFGGPEVLKVFNVPEPHAGPGEVRIRVFAAAVNPTDTMTRSGARAEMLKEFAPPYVPGMDAAGVIDEIGAPQGDSMALRVGQRVMAIVVPKGGYGAYSEHIVVPARSVAEVPTGVTFEAACTLPMNGLTARRSLDQLALRNGQTLAVTGAAGAYGGYLVQLAKHEGLHVIADASEADDELVRTLGADIVVRRGPDVASRILAVVPGGVDALADGSVQNDAVFPAIRTGGQYVSVRGYTGEPVRGITSHHTWVREYATEQEKLAALGRLAESGALSLRVGRVFPAADAARAHEILHAGGTRGRLVLQFHAE